MRNNFDYFKRVESPEMYLCNPDQKEIGALVAQNRHLILRFNDLSTLTFTAPRIEGTEDIYDRIETRRMIFIENIGWFQITNAKETVEGEYCYKDVTAESQQTVFKNKGFVTEERVYMFYNPNDPIDAHYDSSNVAAIPSVVGQLHQQLGLRVNLQCGDIEPSEDFGEWTLIYIDPRLVFEAKSYGDQYVGADGVENICRSFTENTTYGYDFMVKDAEKAFEVIFEFDFLYHTIKVKPVDQITHPTNIYLSLDNIINSLSISEKADNIVTVLTCNGNDLDIRTVNPMGTNYIVDFSYYKKLVSDDGTVPYPWMSSELIEALNEWEDVWNSWKIDDEERTGHVKGYVSLVKDLYELYLLQSKLQDELQTANLKTTDLQTARDQYITEAVDTTGKEIITVESVKTGKNSMLSDSAFNEAPFKETSIITAYTREALHIEEVKDNDVTRYEFQFDGDGTTGSCQSMLENFVSNGKDDDGDYIPNEISTSPLYFTDDASGKSYCVLSVSAEVGVVKDEQGNIGGTGSVEIRGDTFKVISGSESYRIEFSGGSSLTVSKSNSYFTHSGNRYQILQSADGITSVYCFYVSGFKRYTTYQSLTGETGWCALWEASVKEIDGKLSDVDAEIGQLEKEQEYIAENCNVQKYIKRRGENLYNELAGYWIEGEYRNENLAVLSTTTMADCIDLANELMSAGEKELERASQPTFEMSIDAINFIKLIEFKAFTDELSLGKVITIEKNDSTHYRPALVSIEYDLDETDTFILKFSTAAKLDETAMTFADLINESASTSRTISANWSNLTDYWKNKDKITSLINSPLDRTLRAAQANMSNQEFTIDSTGILGRKWSDDSQATFLPEQIRLINNTILFTDDTWDSVRTALGRIYYDDYDQDGNPQEKQAYGLVAEVLVGSLVMSEALKIKNQENTITLDQRGITIYNDSGDTMFQALISGGVIVNGYATEKNLENEASNIRQEFAAADGKLSSTIEQNYKDTNKELDLLEDKITDTENRLESKIEQTAGEIRLTVSEIEKTQISLGEAQKNLDDKQKEFQEAQENLERVQNDLGSSQEEIKAAQEELKNAQDALDEAQKNLENGIKETETRLESKIEQTANTILLSVFGSTTEDDIVFVLGNQIREKETEIENLKAQIAETTDPNIKKALQAALVLKQSELSQLNASMAEYENSLAYKIYEQGLSIELKASMGEVEAQLGLYVKRDDNDQIVSMLNASADVINLSSNRLTITSDYFTLEADGTLTATAGILGGLTLKSSIPVQDDSGNTLITEGLYGGNDSFSIETVKVVDGNGNLISHESKLLFTNFISETSPRDTMVELKNGEFYAKNALLENLSVKERLNIEKKLYFGEASIEGDINPGVNYETKNYHMTKTLGSNGVLTVRFYNEANIQTSLIKNKTFYIRFETTYVNDTIHYTSFEVQAGESYKAIHLSEYNLKTVSFSDGNQYVETLSFSQTLSSSGPDYGVLLSGFLRSL